MDEPERLVIQKADDLAGPVVARLRDMATRYVASQAALEAMHEEMTRFLAVADLLQAAVPDHVRMIARGGKGESADGRGRWVCAICGWQGKGRHPGQHRQVCKGAPGAGGGR